MRIKIVLPVPAGVAHGISVGSEHKVLKEHPKGYWIQGEAVLRYKHLGPRKVLIMKGECVVCCS